MKEMMSAKESYHDMTDEEIYFSDYKEYSVNEKTYAIPMFNVRGLEAVEELGMLGIDGEETADRIRKLGDSDKLKIVIMDDESVEKRRSYDSADMIVERPLFASDVSRTIATLYGINAENRKKNLQELRRRLSYRRYAT